MNTVIINKKKYLIPACITENNTGCYYNDLHISEVFTGFEDMKRIDDLGGDGLNETECFNVYGLAKGINADEDASISDIGNALFAYFSNTKGDEFELHLLEEA